MFIMALIMEAEKRRRDSENRRAMRNEFIRAKAERLGKTMQCFCDLDSWEPQPITGHSIVCPIHKEAMA